MNISVQNETEGRKLREEADSVGVLLCGALRDLDDADAIQDCLCLSLAVSLSLHIYLSLSFPATARHSSSLVLATPCPRS